MADPRRAAVEATRRRALDRRARVNELLQLRSTGRATDEELAELAALVEEHKAR